MLLVGFFVVYLAVSTSIATAVPPSIPYTGTYVTDKPVFSFDRYGSTTYLGGTFSAIGPRVGHGAVISRSTGQVITGSLDVAGGDIETSESDGNGGIYIGGSFSHIGGIQRNRLAHINADGSLDSSWDPGVNGTVYSLERDGTTLYVGGQFTDIGSQARNRIAAVDTTTGTPGSWNPGAYGLHGTPVIVYALATTADHVIAGGSFTNIGGEDRNRIAALSKATGMSEPTWNPNSNGPIYALNYELDPMGSFRLFVGGSFSNIGGFARNNIAELNTTTGAAERNVKPNTNGTVFDIDVYGSTIYFGGDFSTVSAGWVSRSNLAAFDTTSGTVTGWDPGASNPVHSVAVSPAGSTVYVGGDFTSIAGGARYMLAELDTTTGSATSWSPMANNGVRTLNVSSNYVFAGGGFTSVGVVERKGLAAIGPGGAVTSWDPSVNGDGIFALKVSADGGTLYAGGQFGDVNGGQPRSNVAAFNTSTGTATSWNPGANNRVSALEIIGSTVYMGGQFTTVDSQPRNRLAAVGLTTGSATSWDPGANGDVLKLEPSVSGNSIYAGGSFTTVNGATSRNRVAELSLTNGTATSWNPNAYDVSDPSNPVDVYDIEATGSSVYVGGSFTGIGAADRNRLAEINSTTALATSWDPNLNDTVRGLATDGSTVYAAGNFTTVNAGATNRGSLAGFNRSDAVVTSWDPSADYRADAIEVLGATVYAGGQFTTVSNYSHRGLAQFTAAPANTSAPAVTGTGYVGDPLNCSSGSWNDQSATLTHRWLRDGSPISGETGPTYTTAETDIGYFISCEVTAANVGGDTTVTSNSVTVTTDSDSPPSTPATPAVPTTGGDTHSPQITDLKVSPSCQRLSANSKTKEKGHGRRVKGSRSGMAISYTLSEDATVTISVRAKRESKGLHSRCSTLDRRKKGKVKVPGTYSEVERIVQSGTSGSNSTSLDLSPTGRPASLAGVSLPSFYSSAGPAAGNIGHVAGSHAQKAASWSVVKRHRGQIRRAKQSGVAVVATTSRNDMAGKHTVRLSGRLLSKKLGTGSYKVYVSAVDPSGNASSTETAKFYLLPTSEP